MVDEIKGIKDEVRKYFKDLQFIYLATCEGDQPRVRPVTLVCLDERFWIFTGTDNAKTQQIQKNPKIEFCLSLEKKERRGYVRAAGLAKIIQDKDIKLSISKRCDFFSRYWESPDDPNYTLIELQLVEIEYWRPDDITVRKFKL